MRDRRTRLLSLMTMVLLGAAMAPSAASAAPSSIADLSVDVGGPCITGRGEPGIRHTVTLRAPDGTYRARSSDRSNSEGEFFVCLFGSGLTIINPGDRVTVRTRAGSETLRISDLRPRIDRRADTIWGRGPKGAIVRVRVYPFPDRPRTFTVPVDGRGYWRMDTTGELDIIGADAVEVRFRRGGDEVRASGYAPYLQFGADSNIVTGAATVGGQPTITLSRGGITFAAATAISLVGSIVATLETPKGRAVYPRAGDVVSSTIAGGITLRVPISELTGDASADRVWLRCMPRARYGVTVRDATGSWQDLVDGKTDAQGRAVRGVGLRGGYTLDAFCQYPGGDILLLGGTVE